MSTAIKKPARVAMSDFEEMLFDCPEDEKWELIAGVVVKSMVGARLDHHTINSNVQFALESHLRQTKRPCTVFRETFYLKRDEEDLAALPDLMVHCKPVTLDVTSVREPVILIEVVSPTSAYRDHFQKRVAYTAIPSLNHYVLINRDEMVVEHYVRTPEGFIGQPQVSKPEDRIPFADIDFTITLAEIYAGVLINPS